MILTELIVNMRSTAELAYLAETDENFNWLISNQNRPISTRRIQQILTDYFPEFHIQATHKQNKKDTKIRTEQIHKSINEEIDKIVEKYEKILTENKQKMSEIEYLNGKLKYVEEVKISELEQKRSDLISEVLMKL